MAPSDGSPHVRWDHKIQKNGRKKSHLHCYFINQKLLFNERKMIFGDKVINKTFKRNENMHSVFSS